MSSSSAAPGLGPRSASSSEISRVLPASSLASFQSSRGAASLRRGPHPAPATAPRPPPPPPPAPPPGDRRRVGPDQRARRRPGSGVLMERTAARLPGDLHHAISVGLERPPAGAVHVSEERVHDAATKYGDGRTERRKVVGGFRFALTTFRLPVLPSYRPSALPSFRPTRRQHPHRESHRSASCERPRQEAE